MDETTKRRLLAAGKMAFGAARLAGGVATGTGHGLVGGFLRSHHMMGQAARLGADGVKKGLTTLEEGLEDWRRA